MPVGYWIFQHHDKNKKLINPYKERLGLNNVEYSTATGPYWNIYYAKVIFCMPDFSIRNIISHYFHFNDYEGDTCVGYGKIINRDVIINIGLIANFKHKVI